MSSDRLWILLARKKSGEATPAELEELKALLAENSSSGFSHEIIDKIWDASVRSIPESNIPAGLWKRIEEKTGSPLRSKILFPGFKRWIAAAAILVVLSAAAVAVLNYSGSANKNAIAGQKNINQVSTQPGSKSKLELPDGTQVWLNGNSKLTYSNGSFGKTDREVILTGEAFFDVVKNAKVPFIIHTGPVNITVMGTAFNVKAYPKEKTIETSLVRGLVEITTEQDPDRRILLKPNEKIIIPVERARHSEPSANTTDSLGASLISITKLKTTDKEPEEIAWMNDQLTFDDEPLSVIAPKMEKWYHIKIHFTGEEVKNKRFSGVIETESLKETLEAMQLSWHFTYELKGDDLWIGSK